MNQQLQENMEAAFSNLEKEGKTDVDSLVRWMKESKVISPWKDAEDKVRGLLTDAAVKNNVTMDKFKNVVQEVSIEFRRDLDGVTRRLGETGPKILEEPKQGPSGRGRGIKKTFMKVVKSLMPPSRK